MLCNYEINNAYSFCITIAFGHNLYNVKEKDNPFEWLSCPFFRWGIDLLEL